MLGGLATRGYSRERNFSKTCTDEDAVLLEGRKAHLELNLKREEKEGREEHGKEEDKRYSEVKGREIRVWRRLG